LKDPVDGQELDRKYIMSTNALIGIVNKDNSLTTSYVHYDGYPEGVGDMLLSSYNEETVARKISELGYMSSLQTTYQNTIDDSVHVEDPIEFENVLAMELYMQNHINLEYGYLWYRKDQWWFTENHPKQIIWKKLDITV
jgi:hypothetical protein